VRDQDKDCISALKKQNETSKGQSSKHSDEETELLMKNCLFIFRRSELGSLPFLNSLSSQPIVVGLSHLVHSI
jgi:hypothetical protein